jgi:hypothetical protein
MTKQLWRSAGFLGLGILFIACASPGARNPANEIVVEPALKYFTYKGGQPTSVQTVTPQQWAGHKWHENRRFDLLLKIHAANTRAESNSGLRHAACFDGDGHDIIESFFFTDENKQVQPAIGFLQNQMMRTAVSTDGLMIGVGFKVNKDNQSKPYYFRLPNCNAGKSPIGAVAPVAELSEDEALESTQAISTTTATGVAAQEQKVRPTGFDLDDKDQAQPSLNLPQFRLRADYEKADRFDKSLPWRDWKLKLDVRNENDALVLALILQKYFYDSMANQDSRNPDRNFIAENNRQRYWCHMPWMQVGPQGRESIHGLTKELDLKPSPTMDLFKTAVKGTDWGVAYYNYPGCKTILNAFGSVTQPKPNPDFSKVDFNDGTVSAKILFTTAEFDSIKDAYVWQANTVQPGETKRHIMPMRHIQMDIALRDSTIKGMKPELNNWAMFTYYFDPNYDYDREHRPLLRRANPLKSIPNLPPQFLKMRPMGIQTGFGKPETGDTILFAGAQTNGLEGRLNGPADNPKSSCLSCHGAAGVSSKIMPMVPGTLDNQAWRDLPGRIDFSQQMALAKRNIETWLQMQPQ